jgi:hypothetical protein
MEFVSSFRPGDDEFWIWRVRPKTLRQVSNKFKKAVVLLADILRSAERSAVLPEV